MTPRVDHEHRRRRIADALWRIAASRGLQHYFPSKDDLLVVTLELIGREAERRGRDRLAGLGRPPSAEAVVRETLTEMLPLGAESRSGLRVHVAYLARAVHDPRLRAVTADGIRALRDLLAEMLRRAAGAGQLAAGRDPDTEAMTLICLAEGVSNYVLLDTLTPAEGSRLVETHLAGLLATPG